MGSLALRTKNGKAVETSSSFKKIFSTKVTLADAIYKDLEEVTELTAKELLGVLVDIIFEEVYFKTNNLAGNPINDEGYNIYGAEVEDWSYDRTLQLADMWTYTMDKVRKISGDTKNQRKGQTNEFGQRLSFNISPTKENAFTTDASKLQHASPETINNGKELTPYDFAIIINEGTNKDNMLGKPIPARPFWDKFLEYVHENYQKIFEKYCRMKWGESFGKHLGGVGEQSLAGRNQMSGRTEGSSIIEYK